MGKFRRLISVVCMECAIFLHGLLVIQNTTGHFFLLFKATLCIKIWPHCFSHVGSFDNLIIILLLFLVRILYCQGFIMTKADLIVRPPQSSQRICKFLASLFFSCTGYWLPEGSLCTSDLKCLFCSCLT